MIWTEHYLVPPSPPITRPVLHILYWALEIRNLQLTFSAWWLPLPCTIENNIEYGSVPLKVKTGLNEWMKKELILNYGISSFKFTQNNITRPCESSLVTYIITTGFYCYIFMLAIMLRRSKGIVNMKKESVNTNSDQNFSPFYSLEKKNLTWPQNWNINETF